MLIDTLLVFTGTNEKFLLSSFLLMIPLELYLAHIFKVSKIKFFFASFIAVYFSYLIGRIFHVYLDAYKLVTTTSDVKVWLRYFLIPSSSTTMFYGSLIGCQLGIALIYPLLKKDKAAYLRCFDITIICFAFTAIFSRFDDFRFTDAWGFPFDSPFSLVFPSGSVAARHLAKRGVIEMGMPTPPLFPTQPIMIMAKIIIFFVLLLKCFQDKKKVPLNYVALYLLMYGPYRVCIDFCRFDRAAYFGGLTISQWLSVLFFVVALLYYKFLYKKLEQKYCLNEIAK